MSEKRSFLGIKAKGWGCMGKLLLLILLGLAVWQLAVRGIPAIREKIAEKRTAPTETPAVAIVAKTATSVPAKLTAVPATATPAIPKATAQPTAQPTAVTKEEPTITVVSLPTVKAGFPSFISYLNMIVIKVLKLDQKYGFNLEMSTFGMDGSPDPSEDEQAHLLATGQLDVLLTTMDKLPLPAPGTTTDTIGIGTTFLDETTGADMVKVNQTIISMNDLAGKKISYQSKSISEFITLYVLNLAGLGPQDVVLMPKDTIQEAVLAYKNGECDVVVGWLPEMDDISKTEARILVDSSDLRIAVDVLLVSHQAIQQKPEAILAFHEAWYEALDFQFRNPEEAERLVASWGHGDWTFVDESGGFVSELKTVAQAGLSINELALNDKDMLTVRMNNVAAVWQNAGIRTVPVEGTKFFDPRFVNEVAKRHPEWKLSHPQNNTFIMSGRLEAETLSPEILGKTRPLAKLPLEKVMFEPNKTRLSDQGMKQLDDIILPPLLATANSVLIYIEGSAAKPPQYTIEESERVANDRVYTVYQYLVSHGVDKNRIVMGYIPPQYPDSKDEAQLEKDRYVRFTLMVRESGM